MLFYYMFYIYLISPPKWLRHLQNRNDNLVYQNFIVSQ